MNYVTKRFLSDTDLEETGSIVCKANTTDFADLYHYSAKNPSVCASIMVRDCYGKPVELEFSVSSTGHSVAEREAKVDLLIAELQAFKAALPRLYDQAVADGERWLEENPEEAKKPRRRRGRTLDDVLGGE